MAQDLRREDRNVVATVGLACNVEVLMVVLGELLEEQLQKCVNVLSSIDGVGNRIRGVRVADIDWLVQENDRGVVVPRVWVVHRLQALADGRRAQLKEQTSQGRAARATVQPQNNRVVFGVVTRLKQPEEKVLVFILHIQITGVLLDRVHAQILGSGLGTDLVVGETGVGHMDVELGLSWSSLFRSCLELQLAHSFRELGEHFCPQLRGSRRKRFRRVVYVLGNLGKDVALLFVQGRNHLGITRRDIVNVGGHHVLEILQVGQAKLGHRKSIGAGGTSYSCGFGELHTFCGEREGWGQTEAIYRGAPIYRRQASRSYRVTFGHVEKVRVRAVLGK